MGNSVIKQPPPLLPHTPCDAVLFIFRMINSLAQSGYLVVLGTWPINFCHIKETVSFNVIIVKMIRGCGNHEQSHKNLYSAYNRTLSPLVPSANSLLFFFFQMLLFSAV